MANHYGQDILEFLLAWQHYLLRWGIKDGKGYWKQLMKDVETIFKDVTKAITQGSGENAGICGSIYTGAETNVSTCKSRCHEIANLMLYIKGYSYSTGNWTKRLVDDSSGEMFMEYLRCTLATEVLLQVYGTTSDHQEVIKKVKEQLAKTDAPGQKQYEPGVCEDQDYGPVIFGLRGIGEALNTRLQKWQQGLAGGNTRTTHGTGQTCAWAHRQRAESDQKCHEEAGVITKDSELMRDIKYWVEHGPAFQRVKKMLDDIQKQGPSKEKCQVLNKVKDEVKKVKDTVTRMATTAAGGQAAGGRGLGRGSVGGPGKVGSSRPATGPGRPRRPTPPAPQAEPPNAKTSAAKPVPAKPVDSDGNATKPVAATPVATNMATQTRSRRMARRGGDAGGAVGEKGKGKKHETQEKCQGEKILDWRPRTIYVEHGYSVSLSTVRKEEDERGTDGTDNLFIRRHAYV
ncbi:hypothetical protein AK88_05311 [Plasmodium fragile]|uniref:Schizont-infected cell agglutination extracellular alpha domain-containing protein n=1 Tax=Plasmodium fragile TaxID=5857 RepID=A0A0D9QH52_PLAFR|nr:uncharacterized protein AK88_05311 [Plasmodium fragile]KJP85056.1 hypothetical protein AK88_05311 [Plasmodium fragile]